MMSRLSTFTGKSIALLGLVFSSFALAKSSSKSWQTDATYTNTNPTNLAADVYVRWDTSTNAYWAYSTEGMDDGWLFAIYTSPDMTTWSKIEGGAIKNATESANWAQDWYWAPECYHNVG